MKPGIAERVLCRKGFGSTFYALLIGCVAALWSLGLTAAQQQDGAEAFAPDAGGITIESPNRIISARFYVSADGRLSYDLSRNGIMIIEESPLGATVDNLDLGMNAKLDPSSTWPPIAKDTSVEFPVRGNHNTALNTYRAVEIPLVSEVSARKWRVQVRAYDQGLAWRYIIPGNTEVIFTGEATGFKLPQESKVFFQKNARNYEGIWKSRDVSGMRGRVGVPITVELTEDSGFVVITEAALYGYSGMMLGASGDGIFRAVFPDDKSWPVEARPGAPAQSPWRVIIAASTLDELVNCDMVYCLNPAPSQELFSASKEWIRPGRSLWSWWSEGTRDMETQRRYVDAAARLGFEYVLVDAGWEKWTEGEKDHWTLMAELADYADDKDVDIWVWKSWSKLRDADYRNEYFRKVSSSGAVGVKIDYMDCESMDCIEFYESALKDAASYKLMVNFHGANKPTGESRSYPNEMTREGIRGLEYNKFGIPLYAYHNVTLPFTRLVAGHGDYTPVTFNPRKLGRTSFSHQLAMPVVFLSPVTHYAARPENILDNPATVPAMDVIKSIPTVWDETVVLEQSELGECAVFARRSGDAWFVGAINGKKPRTITIKLDFLDAMKYNAVILADVKESKAGFARTDKKVGARDAITADMRRAGGLVVMMTPEK